MSLTPLPWKNSWCQKLMGLYGCEAGRLVRLQEWSSGVKASKQDTGFLKQLTSPVKIEYWFSFSYFHPFSCCLPSWVMSYPVCVPHFPYSSTASSVTCAVFLGSGMRFKVYIWGKGELQFDLRYSCLRKYFVRPSQRGPGCLIYWVLPSSRQKDERTSYSGHQLWSGDMVAESLSAPRMKWLDSTLTPKAAHTTQGGVGNISGKVQESNWIVSVKTIWPNDLCTVKQLEGRRGMKQGRKMSVCAMALLKRNV